jgi:hypothetical protein
MLGGYLQKWVKFEGVSEIVPKIIRILRTSNESFIMSSHRSCCSYLRLGS